MTTSFRTAHPSLVVVSASRASKLCLASTRDQISALLSISDRYPEHRPPAGVFHALPSMRLTFDDDTEREGGNPYGGGDVLEAPTYDDVERVIRFGRGAGAFVEGKRLLVHCFAGVSRSTASAFAILADRLGPGREDEAMVQLVSACETTPLPNLLIAAHADRILGRGGALLARARAQNGAPLEVSIDGAIEGRRAYTPSALLNAVREGKL